MTDMPDDPFEAEEWQQYAQRALDELLPMMRDSAVVISMVPKGRTDVKFAVELGFSIMLDKPIIAMISPGTQVSSKLAKIADHIVEWDPSGDMTELQTRLMPIIEQITKDDDD